ncbi:MGMT family protein [Ruminococcaceae bacterium OttesenSCG-928-A16]|nr:MGMT family protein [Ruminococcaceae bacterium OttesenSCG-928-A16]
MKPPAPKNEITAQQFAAKIYAIVAQIPAGKVASYGQLALLAGYPQWARRAGKAMGMAPRDLTSHRVVNSAGRLVPGWPQQRQYLQQEGVTFTPGGLVNMRKHRWHPFE